MYAVEVYARVTDEAWRSDHDGRFGLRITATGLRAIGVPALVSGLESEPAGRAAEPTTTPQQKAPRPGSKQARLITMLMQPDGRSIEELAASLGWLPHTVRAAITGLRKAGHVVVRAKNDAGVSVYRIEPAADA